jgi:hypothetical protein
MMVHMQRTMSRADAVPSPMFTHTIYQVYDRSSWQWWCRRPRWCKCNSTLHPIKIVYDCCRINCFFEKS